MYGLLFTVVSMLFLSEITAQGTHSQNMLVVSKHDPGGELAPKSQQVFVVSPRLKETNFQNVLNPLIFPSQLPSSFLPAAILSNSATIDSSPVATTTTVSGFNGINQSSGSGFKSNTETILDSTNHGVKATQRANRQINALSGLIKASAEDRIRSVLLSGLVGGLASDKQENPGNVDNDVIKRNAGPLVLNPRTVIPNANSNHHPTPLVLRNRQGLIESTLSRHSARMSSGGTIPLSQTLTPVHPLVLTRQPTAASRPLVLAPQRQMSTRRGNTETPTQTLPVTPVISQASINPRLQTTRSTLISRQFTRSRTPTITTAGQQTAATQIQIRTNQRTAAETRTRTNVQIPPRSSGCPSLESCRVVVPATCRRQTTVTHDSGRRCRSCDEDGCAFSGFEGRWGRGFG